MASYFALLTNLRGILLCFCIAAVCTGLAGKQFISRTDFDFFLTLWKGKVNGQSINIGDINCTPVRTRLRGAAGCAIISAISYLFLLILTIGDLILGHLKATTIGYSLISLVAFSFGLAAWALVAVVYHRQFCGNFQPIDDGLKYGYGFPLLVSAWCAFILTEAIRLIGNLVYAKEKEAANDDSNKDIDDAEKGEETEDQKAERIRKRDAKRARHAERREKQQEEMKAAKEKKGPNARVSFANAPDHEETDIPAPTDSS